MNQLSPTAPDLTLSRCRAVALLVDGENLSHDYAGRVITATLRDIGQIAVQRVYGDTTRLNGWLSAPGFRAIHAHAGKNVADMLMTVEAMELSYGGHVDGFALASRDRDFAPLAWSLRARGFQVLGLLPDETGSEHLLRAFGRVARLSAPSPSPSPRAGEAATKPTPPAPTQKPQPVPTVDPVRPAPVSILPDLAAQPVDPALLSAIEAILSNGPMTTIAFGTALKEAGFIGTKGTQSWQAWFARRPGMARFTETGGQTLISKT